jgi:putative transposase
MVVKYRRKVINDMISDRLKTIFEDIGEKYHIIVKEWNHDIDHIHVLMTAKPNTELSKFINAYKSASSRRIKNEFPKIREELWKESFWSQSYCLLSVGGAPLEILKQYIETQGQN